MKNLFFIILIATGLGLVSCNNFDTDFPDYDYTAGYFPYQFPERILVLGDYIYDNSNDNAHKFVISAAFGGVYKNKKDRVFNIQVDESLCNNIYFSDGSPIKALPSNYYTLSNSSQITIPKGEFNGGIEVQLTDAFFSDPDAIKNTYVIPIRMLSSNDVDSILQGYTTTENADIRISSQWTTSPKNFTMFGVKFINEWHGHYLHYGSCTVKDASGTVVETNTYSEKYVENNNVYMLTTTARFQASLSSTLECSAISLTPTLLFNFNGDNCTITAPSGANYTVTGSGTFKTNAYSWGDKPRNGIEYSYTLTTSDGMVYSANDVLVARDRAVTLETYTPKLK